MKPQLHEFPEVVEELVQGGFSEPQSTSLVKFVSRVLSGHHEHLDAVKTENREQFAISRKETQAGFDQLKGWMIAMFSALLVAFVGAATASMIQQ